MNLKEFLFENVMFMNSVLSGRIYFTSRYFCKFWDILVVTICFIFIFAGIFCQVSYVTLIWVGFLGVRFEMGGKISPCLKLVRIMLETWNLVRKYTHM